MNKFKNILWGITFILIGLIIGLNALEVTNINLFFEESNVFFIVFIPMFN